METPEERRQRVRQEKQLSNRLQLATTRLEAAQQERLWAIAAAYEAGLSMRNIAPVTGLSSSRVHQLLNDEESREAGLTHENSGLKGIKDFYSAMLCFGYHIMIYSLCHMTSDYKPLKIYSC